jgi:hypothetical protein
LGYTSTIFIGSHPSEGRENSTKDLGKYLFVKGGGEKGREEGERKGGRDKREGTGGRKEK